jgi:hypothetical protein
MALEQIKKLRDLLAENIQYNGRETIIRDEFSKLANLLQEIYFKKRSVLILESFVYKINNINSLSLNELYGLRIYLNEIEGGIYSGRNREAGLCIRHTNCGKYIVQFDKFPEQLAVKK